MSDLSRPASSRARIVAWPMRSRGVSSGPTSPRSDSATPTTATLPRKLKRPPPARLGVVATMFLVSNATTPKDGDRPVLLLAHGDQHPQPDPNLLGGHPLHPAHHAKPLFEVHEDDVVRLGLAAVHGGRGVHDAAPGAGPPSQGVAPTDRAQDARLEDRRAATIAAMEAQ